MHVTLCAGDLVLEVLPGLGGAVTGFQSGGFPIFRAMSGTLGSVSDCASFPLIPFSNRIRGGFFRFGGSDHQIPVDRRDPRFTNHGHTRHLPWEVVAASSTELILRFTEAEPIAAWPFPFTAEQVFTLSAGGLRMRARIRNDHTVAAPAGIGFHPYFTRLPDTMLGFYAECLWETDALDIPIRSVTPTGRFDFSTPRRIPAPLINHAYGGWRGSAEIVHPGRFHIGIGGSGALDQLIVFTPEGKDFFGFEPVSHRPDALNALADSRDEGMTLLAPGAWLEGSMDVTISKY